MPSCSARETQFSETTLSSAPPATAMPKPLGSKQSGQMRASVAWLRVTVLPLASKMTMLFPLRAAWFSRTTVRHGPEGHEDAAARVVQHVVVLDEGVAGVDEDPDPGVRVVGDDVVTDDVVV